MKSKFKEILIAYKNGLKSQANEIKHLINSFDKEVSVLCRNHNHIKDDEMLNKDLVITFGGDGTFIDLANRIKDQKILGINSSPLTSEGALTVLDINNLEKIFEVLSGNYKIISRTRAKVRLNGVELKELSTNEVYVGAKSQFHSSRYIIKFKGKSEEQRSSGIIVSTGTGSPAWFKSAGGKEFGPEERRLFFIIREPYPGKNVFIPTIKNGEISFGEQLVLESTRDFGGILALGFKTYKFNKGDIAVVEISEKPLNSITL